MNVGGGDNEYIYNPTAQVVVEMDGRKHLPQLRRSSLTSEEEALMEKAAVRKTTPGGDGTGDANVNVTTTERETATDKDE
eukprot:CAMPEP_0202701176 /NCGR_PEP_ID=MMETSP1385-20130828/14283_1 /ASSEMBLY_ACC=CAM_ASM_000861 /TAXON_ID=933848 /ORGANISM="Elphidium margaritaceum" /LENGTH=79 /DNA_ID=CAMNT_0049358533 /DNA_START=1 /DNA_END=237 /DNA_ORIENTATION=-